MTCLHLESWARAALPVLKRVEMEHVQGKAGKVIAGMKQPPSEKQLNRLNLLGWETEGKRRGTEGGMWQKGDKLLFVVYSTARIWDH